jgi:hypothetical protein
VALPAVNVTRPWRCIWPKLASTATVAVVLWLPAAGNTVNQVTFDVAVHAAWLVLTVTGAEAAADVGDQLVCDKLIPVAAEAACWIWNVTVASPAANTTTPCRA